MKLDLSALPEKQREEVRRIVDGNDEAMVWALKLTRAESVHGRNLRKAIRANARICAAIGRAQRARQKGTQ